MLRQHTLGFIAYSFSFTMLLKSTLTGLVVFDKFEIKIFFFIKKESTEYMYLFVVVVVDDVVVAAF
jgi:hypothetical protein